MAFGRTVLVAMTGGLVASVLSAQSPTTAPVRVKDVAALQGIPSVPLIGYGLVAGLTKTGDRQQTIFPAQTLANMLARFGVLVPGAEVRIENIAAVLVTAELPPFARPGARLDVTVSSVGDARSLQGGTLMPTPLNAPDGSIQVLAQGPLSIGGFGGGGRAGNAVQVNHLTSGRVPGGGMVQVGPRTQLVTGPTLTLSLREPDFETARRLAEAVNADLGAQTAHAIDAAAISVKVPSEYRDEPAGLMARLEMLLVSVDAPARVVINERTGTVVVGAGVRLGPAAVAHGNLSVRISTQYDVSQPSPLSRTGETVVVPQEQVDVNESNRQLVVLEEGTTLDVVVRALNALGATPRDIIAIMQALKVAGALRAEVVII